MADKPKPKLIDESTTPDGPPKQDLYYGIKKTGDGYEVIKAYIQGERVVKFESITPGVQPMVQATEDLLNAIRTRVATIE